MDDGAEKNNDNEPITRNDILEQAQRLLKGDVQEDAWHATEEDFIIVQCLLGAVRAARRKGYGDDLLIRVLRGLIQSSPGS
jgi:hypothetical protein